MVKSRYEVGLCRCSQCRVWKAIYTSQPETYSFYCPRCDKTQKIKDKRNGGMRVETKWLDTDKMEGASRVAGVLNMKNAPRIQKVIKKELSKPPHKRRDIYELTKDIEPKGFTTYD